jgi:tRNA (uracil-5-)-methyltransferase TRM9
LNLYSEYAQDFSNTRQSPWLGWEHLLQYLYKNQPLRVLDLGCGNGRFLKFLLDKKLKVEVYTGVDSSSELLKIADESFNELQSNNTVSTLELKAIDLEEDNWIKKIDKKYNVVVGFGLMHHLKTFTSRKNIYTFSNNLLTPGGLLILTFWQFAKLDRYRDKIIKADFETHDYVLKFGNKGAERFCHYTDEIEISELEKELEITQIESYFNDGEGLNQNLYIIYGRAQNG